MRDRFPGDAVVAGEETEYRASDRFTHARGSGLWVVYTCRHRSGGASHYFNRELSHVEQNISDGHGGQ